MKRRNFLRLATALPLSSPLFGQESISPITESPGNIEISKVIIQAKTRVDDMRWKNFAIKSIANYANIRGPESKPTVFSIFGGDSSRRFPSSGFFRIEKAPDRWWFVDPSGCAFLSVGLNSVSPAPGNGSVIHEAKDNTWALEELPRIKGWGFNTAGCWSNEERIRKSSARMSYSTCRWPGWDRGFGPLETYMRTRGIGMNAEKTIFIGGILPVFSKSFADFVGVESKRLAQWKDDQWMIGRFLDNELTFPDLDRYLAYEGTNPELLGARNAARVWLKNRHGKTEEGSTEAASVTETDRQEWPGYVYEAYLATVVPAIRREDPNHLIFGPRLHGVSLRNKSIVEAIARWCDVLCANPYGQWSPAQEMLSEWSKFGKPVIISEFYAKSQDSGLSNSSGVGFILKNQTDRGLFYQNYLLSSVGNSAVIGWHWHKYRDHHNGKTGSNKGVVNQNFEPYKELVDRMAEVNLEIYRAANYFRKIN